MTSPARPSTAAPNGKWIVSAAHDRAVRVWDALTLELVSEVVEAHAQSISRAIFHVSYM